MRDIVIACLLVLPFVGWLAAEFYGSRRSRILLGVLCLLVTSSGIYVVIYSTGMQLAMHRMVLRQIDRKLEASDAALVRRALHTYDQTYESTGDSKAAIFRTMSVLSQN
jgi:hypothetical protein